MAIEETPGANNAINPEAFNRSDGELDDATALQLCVQDAQYAKAWIESHWLNARWLEADVAYQSPPQTTFWEGTDIPRSNISRYTVLTHVTSLLAQVTAGFFYDSPPFLALPRPATSQNAVRAITAIQEEQLEAMNFREETEQLFLSALLYGTCIAKWGWRMYTKVKREYKRKGQPFKVEVRGKEVVIPTKRSKQWEIEEKEVICSEPYFESCDIRDVYVDPGCKSSDIRKAKYVIHKQAITYRDLCRIRENQELLGGEVWDLPTEDEIRSWFIRPTPQEGSETGAQTSSTPELHHAAPLFERTTEDPLDEPLEVLERWTDEHVIAVINKTRVIRNSPNTFGEKCFYSANFMDIPSAFWGIGIGSVLAGEQRLQQGLTNMPLDVATLALNPMTLKKRGTDGPTQPIRMRIGGVLEVNDTNDVKQMDPPRVPAEVFAQVQQSEARSEAVSGANELLTMGNMPAQGRTSIGRTATGAGALAAAASARIGAFIEKFAQRVFKPWLWKMHDLNCEFLQEDQYKDILNDALGEAFKLDMEDYLNAGIKEFTIRAGTHLAQKAQMAQSVALMVQIFESPQTLRELAQINGEYVDIGELLHMISDVSGWRNYDSIVKPMTPEMKQAYQAMQVAPAQAQLQGKLALEDRKAQHEEALINQKSVNRAADGVLRKALEKSMESEAINGEPGNGPGFGSNTQG